ncbi:FMN reductase [Brevibacterium sandarakinum]|uniref:FMN reductase n=1 Tax=Brevibacterium sandarakinum TaxID=629680 RepID=A0A1H1QZ41_BRESA|nr:NAD(P)H-dependent oxidoreductase [Brevibacterium sandarakinum]SDS28636.1 FMN reductase [Brevibacterium sandarakinum]
MGSRITAVVGNPNPGSRTRQIAEDLAERIAALTGADTGSTIEFGEVTDEIFEWESSKLSALTDQLQTSTYAVIATPTYKASCTGLLKAFVDRFDAGGLHGVTAIPVFTIGSPAHQLAVDFTLRPLLVELGASVPTAGLSFPTAKFDERAAILDEWVEKQAGYLPEVKARA